MSNEYFSTGWAWTKDELDVVEVQYLPKDPSLKGRKRQQYVQKEGTRCLVRDSFGWYVEQIFSSKEKAFKALLKHHGKKVARAKAALKTVKEKQTQVQQKWIEISTTTL